MQGLIDEETTKLLRHIETRNIINAVAKELDARTH